MTSPANTLRNKMLLEGLRKQGHEHIAKTLEEQMETDTIECAHVVVVDHAENKPMTISASLRFKPWIDSDKEQVSDV